MRENIVSTVFDFQTLTKDDLNSLEVTDGFYSPYNIKAVYMNKIVGYIVVEERNPNFVLKVRVCIIGQCNSIVKSGFV